MCLPDRIYATSVISNSSITAGEESLGACVKNNKTTLAVWFANATTTKVLHPLRGYSRGFAPLTPSGRGFAPTPLVLVLVTPEG
jgi:hypothetical protein